MRRIWQRRSLALFAAVPLVAALVAAAELDPDEYLGYVKFLAAPELKGRGNGTPELDHAAAYIADHFRKLGLKPLHGHSYYQDFDLTTNARLGTHSSLRLTEGPRSSDLRLEQDFVPLNLSAAGHVSAPVVFAGYGITAPEYHYDDYAGVDVTGKVVLILRHEPQENDEKSVFDGKTYTAHAQVFSKAANAKMHGACAVIMVDDAPSHPGEDDKLDKFGASAGPNNAGIVFVQMKWDIAAAWLTAGGKDLKEILKAIDSDLKPRSFELPPSFHAEAVIDITRDVKKVHTASRSLPSATPDYVSV